MSLPKLSEEQKDYLRRRHAPYTHAGIQRNADGSVAIVAIANKPRFVVQGDPTEWFDCETLLKPGESVS